MSKEEHNCFHPFASKPDGPVDPFMRWMVERTRGPSIHSYTIGWGSVVHSDLLMAEGEAGLPKGCFLSGDL